MTQGLITTIEKVTNKVVFKIIAGSNGFNIEKVTQEEIENVIDKWSLPIDDIARNLYKFTIQKCLGSEESLVVSYVNQDDYIQHIDYTIDELSERYWSKFYIPGFNPRWELGTADYNEVIYIERRHKE